MSNQRTRATLAIAALVTALSGCSSSGGSVPEPKDTPAPEAMSTPTADAPDVTCQPDVGPQLALTTLTWDLVLASRGQADADDMMDEFLDYSEELVEAVHDECGFGVADDFDIDAAALGVTTAAGVAEDADYDDLAATGNALIESIGSPGDAEFALTD